MRVLQLAPLWETVPPPGYGGTETVVHALTEELVRRGVDVTLCASGDSCTSARMFSVFPRSLRQAGLCENAMEYSLLHVTLALKEARRGYDLIHSHNGPPSELGMALSHLVDVPMLTTLHNQLTKETQFIWSHYSGWYNTISCEQKRQLPDLPRAQFAGVAHNGIDVASFPFEPEKDGYSLFMGRITPDKAPHLAVQAALQAGRRLVIAGKIAMPEEREYYREVLEPLVDGDMVTYVGEADARLKRELYRRASCLLLPLQWDEPFGLVMVESMACGTPAVVYRRGAASEIVRHGETGFLVEGPDEMADAIDRCREIDPYRCREYVDEHFSPSALADRYQALYERVLREA